MKRIIRLIILFSLTFATTTATAHELRPVHNIDTNEFFETIQAAIDDSDTKDGHTITVDPGIYRENVVVDKQLTIKSTSGNPVNTIINASNSDDHVFNVQADYVKIIGFTVENARGYLKSGIYLSGNVEHRNISYNTALNNHFGIFMDDSSNNMLISNNVSNNYCGIYMSLSSNNTLISNTASKNYYGIAMSLSNNTILSNNIASNNNILSNTALNNDYSGIYVYYSSNNAFINNTASNNGYGIYVYYSSNNNTLTNNTASNNNYGIFMDDSTNNTLTGNTMSENKYNFGVDYPYQTQCIDISNTVNGKPIYYWVDQKDRIIPSDAGFVGVVNSTNITVRDLTLTENRNGVLFVYSENSKIVNVTANSNEFSISLQFSSNNTLTGNNASNNLYGFMYSSSNNNTLTNNTASNNDIGIELFSSSNNLIRNSYFNSNLHGISMHNSNNNTFINSTASNNDYGGIGILYSSNNTLTNNTAMNNKYGITMSFSSNNSLTNSTVSNNDYGIFMYYSSNNHNLIYNNYFNNTNNANDSGNNIWNITKTEGMNIIGGPYLGGNYWSDYAGSDTNDDGLGDKPYTIHPESSNKDYLPLFPVPPHILSATRTLSGNMCPGSTVTVTINLDVTGSPIEGLGISENLSDIPSDWTINVHGGGNYIPATRTVEFSWNDPNGNLGDRTGSYDSVIPEDALIGEQYHIRGVAQLTSEGTTTLIDLGIDTLTIVECPEGIVLQKGWNFISFPGVLTNATPEYVLDGLEIDVAMHYNAQTGLWEAISEFVPRTAYVIKVTSPQTIVNLEYMPAVPPSLQLYEGLNPIGLIGTVPGTENNTAETEFNLAKIDGLYSTIVGPWDPELMGYLRTGYNQNVYGEIPGGETINKVYTENFPMRRYEGYWIYMESNATLDS